MDINNLSWIQEDIIGKHMSKLRFIEHIMGSLVLMQFLIYRAVQRGTAKVKPEEVQVTPTEKVTVAAAVSVVYVVEVRSLVTTSF